MDKEGGGYYFFLEKYDNRIFKIQLNISQHLLNCSSIQVCEQFADSSAMKCGTCSKFGSSAIHEVVRPLDSTQNQIQFKRLQGNCSTDSHQCTGVSPLTFCIFLLKPKKDKKRTSFEKQEQVGSRIRQRLLVN